MGRITSSTRRNILDRLEDTNRRTRLAHGKSRRMEFRYVELRDRRCAGVIHFTGQVTAYALAYRYE